MIQGTASSAGKSTVVTALCKIFSDEGHDVLPYKSQNMSSNYMTTANGQKIATAQYIQAIAAGKEPSTDMNPILLSPTSDMGSEVYFMGELLKVMQAKDYFAFKKELKQEIITHFQQIVKKHDLIVIEGAGSPAEINLTQHDFVNMGMAEIADANVLLVADIDRGGVFASLYGTVKLLPAEQQKRIKGLIINKFRGDVELLRPGLDQLEKLLGIPVLGVLPYTKLEIADEDSLVDYEKKANQCFDEKLLRDEIERLALMVRHHLDMDKIHALIEEKQ